MAIVVSPSRFCVGTVTVVLLLLEVLAVSPLADDPGIRHPRKTLGRSTLA